MKNNSLVLASFQTDKNISVIELNVSPIILHWWFYFPLSFAIFRRIESELLLLLLFQFHLLSFGREISVHIILLLSQSISSCKSNRMEFIWLAIYLVCCSGFILTNRYFFSLFYFVLFETYYYYLFSILFMVSFV